MLLRCLCGRVDRGGSWGLRNSHAVSRIVLEIFHTGRRGFRSVLTRIALGHVVWLKVIESMNEGWLCTQLSRQKMRETLNVNRTVCENL